MRQEKQGCNCENNKLHLNEVGLPAGHLAEPQWFWRRRRRKLRNVKELRHFKVDPEPSVVVGFGTDATTTRTHGSTTPLGPGSYFSAGTDDRIKLWRIDLRYLVSYFYFTAVILLLLTILGNRLFLKYLYDATLCRGVSENILAFLAYF
eukprot:SAG11_NODE_3067_length_2715_cov_1.530581_3_plen_149_part_00